MATVQHKINYACIIKSGNRKSAVIYGKKKNHYDTFMKENRDLEVE